MSIQRNSVVIRVSEQEMAMHYRFRQLGHMESVTPTPEQVAQHARAVELLRELDENPYVYVGGFDYDMSVEPLETERWVPDETEEQWMTRWREHRAAHPNEEPPDTLADQMWRTFTRPSPIFGMALGKENPHQSGDGGEQ